MSEELKQAAQQAISALQCAKRGHCDHAMADEAITALERALTAAQPAQAERDAFEAWTATQPHGKYPLRRDQEGQYRADGTEVAWDAWQARASLPTQPAAQATPEPVGEVVWIQPGHLQKARLAPHLCRVAPSRIAPDFVPLTHPAPGVPEGLPAVLTDWGFDVHDDEEGRTWLTIRNPDDDVARMSVPTVWPLNGNQTIGAVVLHQFSAALTSALAAAQAKGAEHG